MDADDVRALRPLETFAIEKGVLRILGAKGFRYAIDILYLSPETLAAEASISLDSATATIEVVKQDLLCKEDDPSACLHTGVKFLEDLFDGIGIPTGCITEICGQSATGKSQICMELSITSLFSQDASAPEHCSLYIDTEGGVCAKRIEKMANTVCDIKMAPSGLVKNILSNIHYFRVLDLSEQISLIKQLDAYISTLNKVKLVIIDSVAINFRISFSDMKERASYLSAMIQDLRTLAHKYNLAVLVTNHITTKFFDCPRPGCGREIGTAIIPALGESWASAPSHRILLYWEGPNRYARMIKSSRFPIKTVPFRVTVS